MAWRRTKITTTAGIVALALLGAVFAAWKIHHPSVSDRIFRLAYIGLRRAPANVLILRPTHFADSRRHGEVVYASVLQAGKYAMRMMGYKATFAQVIATAYSSSTDRIVLPPAAPKGEYDFLVTVPEKQNERLQAAIKRKLGWVAKWEPHTTDVLALKIKMLNAPALHPSANGAKSSLSFRNGKLRVTHMRLAFLTGFLGHALKQPVVDRTGQTGYYDFSADFDLNRYRNAPNRTMVGKFLNELGLELQPETTSMPMLVVAKAK